MSKKSNTNVEQVELSAEMDIKQIVAESGLSEVYVRRAISRGDLKAHKGVVKEGSSTPKNFIMREDFNAWRAEAGSHTRRADGRNKYVLYMDEAEAKHLLDLIAEEPFAELLTRANVKPAEATTE